MSDLTTNHSSSLDTDPQSITRPKFQPIRLKALLHFCESDDDDDDDNTCESRTYESFKDKSNCDKLHPLLLDKTTEDTLQEESPMCRIANDSAMPDMNSGNGSLKTIIGVSPEGKRPVTTNVSFIQERVYCVSDKENCEVADETSKSHRIGKSSNVEAIIGEHNAILDTSRSLQLTSEVSLHNESAHMLDLSKRREEHAYIVSESKRSLARSSGSHLLNLSKEAQWTTSLESTSTSENPTLHDSARYSSAQYSAETKHETNDNYATVAENACTEFDVPTLSDPCRKGSLTAVADRLVAIDTPLKHVPAQSGVATYKQLFRNIPQNKSGEQSSKSYVQTPSTILPNWIHSGSARYTPMEAKNLIPRNPLQTPRAYTPDIGTLESSRHFGVVPKNVRRPLMDAILAHSDSSTYSLDSKPSLLQTCSVPQCVTASETQRRNKIKKIGLCTEMKLMQIAEVNYDKDLKSGNSIEEAKENRPNELNSFGNIMNVREIACEEAKENRPNALHLFGNIMNVKECDQKKEVQTIGCSMSSKAMQDSSRKCDGEDNVVLNAERDCYPTRESAQRGKLRQIVDKVTNVQFTVPSSVPPQRQSRTLFVKDREYLVLGSLGRGMSGEVLRVQDLSCGELRAIKCVDLSKMEKESAQGCLDEISLLHKLQAPCVIRMFDYHIKDSMVYVVMEMGDTDLSRLLKSMSQEKQIPLMMILYYWIEMLTAVKHIHDNGVIHSDLKPANFLLVRGRLKLIDFGIASNINSDMTSVLKNNTIGTLNYISPESLMDISGNADSPHNVKYKISFKSDVWSLGCILYSLVYGHTPFHHIRSHWAKVHAITNPKLNIAFPITTDSNGGESSCERTPPVLIDVMRKCLQHDPKVRPMVSELLQVQYVPIKPNVAPNSEKMVKISANILMKMKNVLNEEEWRQLVQVLEIKRHHT